MWCLWKSRNDNLFNKKPGNPHQIYQMTQAIRRNMEVHAPHQTLPQIMDTNLTNQFQEQQFQGQQDLQQSSLQVNDDSDAAIPRSCNPATQLPAQGETIRSDLLIAGTKFFTDASWKTKKAPGMTGQTRTGIGVYCEIREKNLQASVLIQASLPIAASALQAEAEAFLLAIKTAEFLHVKQPTFLTDNINLARAVAAPSITQVPWEIRKHIANFKEILAGFTPQVYHISRDINGVAHNCAHQVIRQSLSRPIFSWSNSTHRASCCPIVYAVQQLQYQELVIHAVHCL
jgi:hypothetical protein